MYKALEFFTDLQDNSYAYKVGDEYPRKGYKPSEERIQELSSDKNVRKRPVISAVEVTAEVVDEAEEKPKKRSRKKREE